MADDRPIATIVSKQRVYGATNGSSAYLLAIARSLRSAGFAVELIQPSPSIAGRTPFMRTKNEMQVFSRHVIRGAFRLGSTYFFRDPFIVRDATVGILGRFARMAGVDADWARDRPRPYAVATPWTPEDLEFCRANITSETRIVLADYMFCGPALDFAAEGAGKAIVMHDLFHAREGGDKDSVSTVSRDGEIGALAKADVVLAIQAIERDFVANNVPNTDALLVPMPAEPVAAAQVGKSGEVLFVGSNTAPNVEGLRDFLQNAWPRVLDREPNARLRIAGSVNQAFVGEKFDNAEFLGMVDDLGALYRDAAVVISPLTFGSGLKIKLIEGMAFGKAMVVSGVTLQGVEEVCGLGIMRADEPQQVAEAIGGLLDDADARQRLGAKALDIVRDHFSAETVHADLRDWARSFL